MRFYSSGRWSVGPVGAILLGMLYLALWPVWVVRGAYKVNVMLGHAALAAFVVLLIVYAVTH